MYLETLHFFLEHKIDTSLIAQKPYVRTTYMEGNIEADIDLKNQHRIKKLPDFISIGEPAYRLRTHSTILA